MGKNLDHAFDQYLKANEPDVLKAIPRFAERLEKTGFCYGRFTIPTFYKSLFLSQKQVQLLKRVSSSMMRILNQATRLYFEEGHLAYVYKMNPEAAELIKIDPGYSQNVVLARFDALLEGESLRLVELNCDAPAGAAYGDHAENVFLSDETLQTFIRENQLVKTERIHSLLAALLEAYEEFGGYETPNIAIVDWRSTRTMAEFEFIKSILESKGYKTIIADPRELKYKGGKLYHKNFRIHLIYRRAHFDELLDRLDEVQDMIQAYKDRAVCMVNPLRSRIASTKALLSILTNPQYDHFFTDSENRIKRDHIPWTRRVSDFEEFYGYKKVYIIDFLKDEKDTLVLKPSIGYGGRDVFIGCETPDRDWNAALDKALKHDWVVQEYINIPIMTVPEIVNGKLDFAYKKYNFNLLVFGSRYAGGFTRLSSESVINVARGGGLIPALATEAESDRFEA